MKDNEKYVDDDLVKGLLHMFEGTDSDKNMASNIFNNILNDDNDMNDFMKSFDNIIDENKYKKIIEIEPIPNQEYHINAEYLQICLEHTKWEMNNKK